MLKRKKSSGLDYLSPGLLKDFADEIAEPLHHIINLSLSSSTVPLIWKETRIIPLFKSCDVPNPSNYRPISVLPVLSKILVRYGRTQFIEYLEGNNLLSTNQFEYRKNQSTELAATYFIDNIRKHANNDLGRAWYKWHTTNLCTLISKLKFYGINDNEMSWFCNYLLHRFLLIIMERNLQSIHYLLDYLKGPFWVLCYLLYFSMIYKTV